MRVRRSGVRPNSVTSPTSAPSHSTGADASIEPVLRACSREAFCVWSTRTSEISRAPAPVSASNTPF